MIFIISELCYYYKKIMVMMLPSWCCYNATMFIISGRKLVTWQKRRIKEEKFYDFNSIK